MPKKQYHHKDLRNALIEKGIEIVNSEGLHSFSLRKVAAACGVSHAAPYSHFQSKEELLDAMQQHITDQFSQMLDQVILNYENTPELLKNMGCLCFVFRRQSTLLFVHIFSIQCKNKPNFFGFRCRKLSAVCHLQNCCF